MKVTVQKTEYLKGEIIIPGSKSEAVRAIIFGLLSPGLSRINNLPEGEDLQNAIHVAQAFGAKIIRENSCLILTSSGFPFNNIQPNIDTGNSGITTRFLLPLLGLRENHQHLIHVDCGEQMRNRPIASLFEALRPLGLEIRCLENKDTFPIEVSGQLMGGKTSVSGVTSQFLSSLLIALPLAPLQSEITVHHLNERPYVDLTLAWLKRQNIEVIHQQKINTDIFIIPGNQHYQSFDYNVPGDFSSASYFIAAGVMLPGEVILKGLDLKHEQGDKQFIEIVQSMGARIHCEADQIKIQGGSPLKGLSIDANAIPDLLPTLAVLGTFASGYTEIYNVPQARLKETDRIHSMTQGLREMGAKIDEKADGLIIHPSPLTGAFVKGYGDHRTVMALTLAGFLAEGETQVDDAQAIHKTYPAFMNEMIQLGAKLKVDHDESP